MKSIVTLFLLSSITFLACQSESASDKPAEAPKSMLADQTQTKGKELFQSKCGICHHPIKDMTGPSLKGVTARVPSKEWLYQWIKNPATLLEQQDAYAMAVYEKWNKTTMTAYPDLSNEQIDQIMNYIDNFEIPSSSAQ